MKTFLALVWGVVFGMGLAVSGMTNPGKVQAFLDVAGAWDPSLAFVMGGALAVYACAAAWARGREKAWLGMALSLPGRRDLDPRLVLGSGLFGIGWGLVGLCPGPALANLGRGSVEIAVFVLAMGLGVAVHRLLERRRLATDESALSSGWSGAGEGSAR